MKDRSKVWITKNIQEAKQRIKAELDAIFEKGSSLKERLEFAMLRAAETDDSTSESRLDKLVYAMSALVQHSRYGGLSDVQVSRVKKLIESIFLSEQITPGRSRINFLLGEYHLTLSLLALRESPLLSAWEHEIATLVARPAELITPQEQLWRRLRHLSHLGHVSAAEDLMEASLSSEEKNEPKWQCYRIRLKRFGGAAQEAKDILDGIALDGIEGNVKEEIIWERAILKVILADDFTELMALTSNDGTHYEPEYLIEAILWSQCSQKASLREGLPKVDTIMRNVPTNYRISRRQFRLVRTLDELYDTEIPFHFRVAKFGSQINKIGQLAMIDKELLYWAAAARWAKRSQAIPFARLALSEYEAKSYALSRGRTNDVFNVVSDLQEKIL